MEGNLDYIARSVDNELFSWSRESRPKCLIIRGARQVGKSTAVYNLSKQFTHFLEINFEEQRSIHQIFEGDLDPAAIVRQLSVLFNQPIVPGETLIFFDEIQACVPAISSLRFFYEKMPGLHVIAAGSLLEFALAEIPSFGVGRIRSMFMYPLSFNEFLAASGEQGFLEQKREASAENPLPEALHERLKSLLKIFLIVGGMPEVVREYVKSKDLLQAGRIQNDLTISLKTDFAKYNRRVPYLRIAEVFDAVIQQAGNKFIYARAAKESTQKQIRDALELLIMAGLVIPVTHTSANGIPLGAEVNPKHRKMMLLDTGLFMRLLNLNVGELLLSDDLSFINKGAIAEQHVGLEILKASSCYEQQNLFYWHRESKNSSAEVDYVVQQNNAILPIEVKAGTKGSMKSLHLFLEEKSAATGLRFSMENYSNYDKIQAVPLYNVGETLGNSLVRASGINETIKPE